jgi:hypothetical protein
MGRGGCFGGHDLGDGDFGVDTEIHPEWLLHVGEAVHAGDRGSAQLATGHFIGVLTGSVVAVEQIPNRSQLCDDGRGGSIAIGARPNRGIEDVGQWVGAGHRRLQLGDEEALRDQPGQHAADRISVGRRELAGHAFVELAEQDGSAGVAQHRGDRRGQPDRHLRDRRLTNRPVADRLLGGRGSHGRAGRGGAAGFGQDETLVADVRAPVHRHRQPGGEVGTAQ